MTLSLTDRCDCRCVGCRIWERKKRRELTPREIGDVLRAAPSIRWVNLTGGEPFLRDDLPEIAEAVREALPRLAVFDFPTTGQRTERIVRDVERMAKLSFPRFYVSVSLEGPPALHDRLRGREGAFDRMVETYRALRQVPGVSVFLGMTLSDANAAFVPDALRAVQARLPSGSVPVGWKDLHLNVFTTSAHYYTNEASPLRPPAALRRVVARARRVRERSWRPTDLIEATYLRRLDEHLRTGRSPIPCRSLSASVFIDTAGDVFPCTVWDRRLGNVRESPLYDLLDTEAAAATRAEIARDACPGCWSPCEANPTIVASAPGSLLRGGRGRR